MRCGQSIGRPRFVLYDHSKKESNMKARFLSAILVVALSLGLSTPAQSQKPAIGPGGKPIISHTQVAGIFAIVAGIAVVGTILVIHYSKKRSITGCVTSANNAMTVTDEGNNRAYLLAGNTVGLTPGDRMKLHGRKAKSNGPDKTLVWDTEKVSKDYGVCKAGGKS
jgi:hypothetical protein